MVLIIETHYDSGVEWGVSFTTHDPLPQDYVACKSYSDAERLITALDTLKKQWQREALLEVITVWNKMAVSGVAYSFPDKLSSMAKELE